MLLSRLVGDGDCPRAADGDSHLDDGSHPVRDADARPLRLFPDPQPDSIFSDRDRHFQPHPGRESDALDQSHTVHAADANVYASAHVDTFVHSHHNIYTDTHPDSIDHALAYRDRHANCHIIRHADTHRNRYINFGCPLAVSGRRIP
jgi:hypothetical protein